MSTTNDGYPLATDDVPVYSRNAMRALTAEVEHWKAHAEEAGEGFAQVCRDYARVAARNVVLVNRVSELEAVVERVAAIVPPADEWWRWNNGVPHAAIARALGLDGPQGAQEAAQGDDRGEVGSECADDANVAQMRSKPSPPHRPPPLPNPVWRDGDEKRKR